MKRHRQCTPDTYDLDKPTQGEVDRFLEPALIKHRDTYDTYARHTMVDGPALAFWRAVQTFPPHTTIEQIQDALVRRDAMVRMPADRTVA